MLRILQWASVINPSKNLQKDNSHILVIQASSVYWQKQQQSLNNLHS